MAESRQREDFRCIRKIANIPVLGWYHGRNEWYETTNSRQLSQYMVASSPQAPLAVLTDGFDPLVGSHGKPIQERNKLELTSSFRPGDVIVAGDFLTYRGNGEYLAVTTSEDLRKRTALAAIAATGLMGYTGYEVYKRRVEPRRIEAQKFTRRQLLLGIGAGLIALSSGYLGMILSDKINEQSGLAVASDINNCHVSDDVWKRDTRIDPNFVDIAPRTIIGLKKFAAITDDDFIRRGMKIVPQKYGVYGAAHFYPSQFSQVQQGIEHVNKVFDNLMISEAEYVLQNYNLADAILLMSSSLLVTGRTGILQIQDEGNARVLYYLPDEEGKLFMYDRQLLPGYNEMDYDTLRHQVTQDAAGYLKRVIDLHVK